MNFEEELSKGIFMISFCPKCEYTVWPPNEICSKCFGSVKWEKSSEFGKIIEFSQKEEDYFCLAEFDKGVRIMGLLSAKSKPEIGQKIKLIKAEINDRDYNFTMSATD